MNQMGLNPLLQLYSSIILSYSVIPWQNDRTDIALFLDVVTLNFNIKNTVWSNTGQLYVNGIIVGRDTWELCPLGRLVKQYWLKCAEDFRVVDYISCLSLKKYMNGRSKFCQTDWLMVGVGFSSPSGGKEVRLPDKSKPWDLNFVQCWEWMWCHFG